MPVVEMDRVTTTGAHTGGPSRFAQLRAALEELRESGSLCGLIAAAPAAACRCGFDRALVSRVDASGWSVVAAHVVNGSEPSGRLAWLVGSAPQPVAHTAREAELVRRRSAILVTGESRAAAAPVAGETTIMDWLGGGSYVAAPVVADGEVVGMVHADAALSGRVVDEEDRDVLAIFAETLGHALQRAEMHGRLHELDRTVRGMTESVTAMLHGSFQMAVDRAGAAPQRRIPRQTLSASRLEGLLTRREIEVLGLMANGETNRQIAARLVVSEGTVKSHVKSILRKLHAANRADAVARYYRLEKLEALTAS